METWETTKLPRQVCEFACAGARVEPQWVSAAAGSEAKDERDPGSDNGDLGLIEAVASRAGSIVRGSLRVHRPHTAGTFAICLRKTFTLIVPGCNVAK